MESPLEHRMTAIAAYQQVRDKSEVELSTFSSTRQLYVCALLHGMHLGVHIFASEFSVTPF